MLVWPRAASSEMSPTVLSATGSGIAGVLGPMPKALASSLMASAPSLMPSSTKAVLHERANASRNDAVGLGPQVLPL
ncbi:Uncharacterised protein [Mycobacteroides abscessus subsp. abscessus]|nr:Uncharacterised protein [Mycobacteroides abscessus subsp. abscessus]